MKKRILFIIAGQGSIVSIIRTGLLEIMKDACTPVVAMLWEHKELADEIHRCGFEVHILPKYEVSPAYMHVRDKINYWYIDQCLRSPSSQIERKYRATHFSTWKNIRRSAKRELEKLKYKLLPGYINRLKLLEEKQIRSLPVYDNYENWLNYLQIDGIYTVTPFLPEADLLARSAIKKKIKLLAAIHSFDNVTKRGWVSTFFDTYLVWNKYNKNELQRISPQLKERIHITGAAQFDFHFDKKYLWPKNEWLQKLKLPAGKKIILYGAGVWWLFPNEMQYVQHIDAAIEEGGLPADSIILLRCHPLDKQQRWHEAIQNLKHVVFDKHEENEYKIDQSNYTGDDISKFISTLAYTDVQVNLCSTMAVDGCVFNKPQIGPAYDEINKDGEFALKQMYYQEHYLPIIKTGAVTLANSKEELIQFIKKALQYPGSFTANAKTCLEEIITYTDGCSTARVAELLKSEIRNENTARMS